MRHFRKDLNDGTSAALLVAAVTAIGTGIVVHVWDLEDFGWHAYSGYVMAGLALLHVWLNWRAVVRYTRSRLRHRRSRVPARADAGIAAVRNTRLFGGVGIGDEHRHSHR